MFSVISHAGRFSTYKRGQNVLVENRNYFQTTWHNKTDFLRPHCNTNWQPDNEKHWLYWTCHFVSAPAGEIIIVPIWMTHWARQPTQHYLIPHKYDHYGNLATIPFSITHTKRVNLSKCIAHNTKPNLPDELPESHHYLMDNQTTITSSVMDKGTQAIVSWTTASAVSWRTRAQ